MRRKTLAAFLLGLGLCSEVLASPTLFIYVDEWGHGSGTSGPGFLDADPTGGVRNWDVLLYDLPFKGTPGDLQIYEQRNGRKLAHVIRFTGLGQMIFYSNDVDGLDEPADTPTPPQNAWPPGAMNAVQVDAAGSEGDTRATYEPRAGQPGWDRSEPSYTFVTEAQLPSAPPEPATAALLTVGGLATLLRRCRRR
jgi:hypothetical protein